MDVAGVARVDDDRRLLARARLHQAVVHRAGREERRDRRPVGADAGVGDDEDGGAALDRGDGGVGERGDAALEPGRAVGDGERRVEPGRGEHARVGVEQLLDRARVQEERRQLQQLRGLGPFHEQRLARPEQGAQRHDQALAQVVDRRVRDLREPLLQVVEDRAGSRRDRGEGDVVAHREGRLLGVGGHGLEHHRHLLAGEPERDLLTEEVVATGRRVDRQTERQFEQAVARPRRVVAAAGEPGLHGGVVLHTGDVGVDAEHVARAEPAPTDLAVALDRHRADLGRAHHEPVVAHLPAQRAQPVAVERGADAPAVGEHEPRRAVPGVGEAGVVAVEVAHARGQVALALPRLGHEHRDRVADVAPAPHEQLDRGVELPRVGVVGVEDGPEQLLGAEPGLLGAEAAAGDHAQLVAPHGVDLAVVAQLAERLGPLPRRGGVGGEPAVEHGQRRGEVGCVEVAVERAQPVADHERLVGDGREREAGEVRALLVVAAARLGGAASPERAPVGFDRVDVVRQGQDRLPERGLVDLGGRAELGLVDGDLSPPHELQSFGRARLRHRRLRGLGGRVVEVEERVHHAEAAGIDLLTERLAHDAGEEVPRQRHEESGTVAREPVGGHRLPVADARQPGERQLDDLATRLARRPGHEPDPARVELHPVGRDPIRATRHGAFDVRQHCSLRSRERLLVVRHRSDNAVAVELPV